MTEIVSNRIIGTFLKQKRPEGGGRRDIVTESEAKFDATDLVLSMSAKAIQTLVDDELSSDELGRKLVDWDGPCEVYIVDEIERFFEVGDLSQVTEALLGMAREARLEQVTTRLTDPIWMECPTTAKHLPSKLGVRFGATRQNGDRFAAKGWVNVVTGSAHLNDDSLSDVENLDLRVEVGEAQWQVHRSNHTGGLVLRYPALRDLQHGLQAMGPMRQFTRECDMEGEEVLVRMRKHGVTIKTGQMKPDDVELLEEFLHQGQALGLFDSTDPGILATVEATIKARSSE